MKKAAGDEKEMSKADKMYEEAIQELDAKLSEKEK